MKNSKFYEYELNISNSRIKSLYVIRRDYFKIRINNPESKKENLRSLDDEIRK